MRVVKRIDSRLRSRAQSLLSIHSDQYNATARPVTSPRLSLPT